MILGLKDRSSRGIICMVIRVFSRVKDGRILLICWVCLPR